ncbi:MAG TPA: DUF6146 family protein [Bacteroidales bacterium]|nr:DUF6146 family protein [Bacteroidales bacterium]
MKTVIFLSAIMMSLSMISCGTSANVDSKPIKQTETSDSTEYKLVVFDAGFETWFQQRSQPSWYHSKPFYKSRNQRFTDRWNALVRTGKPGYDTEINYDPTIDYGLELEHKLYYFFKYTGFE